MNNLSRIIAIAGIVLLTCSMTQAADRDRKVELAPRTSIQKAAPVVSAPVDPTVSSATALQQSTVATGQPTQSGIEPSGTASLSPAAPQAGEQIDWSVIASGGNRGTSTNYVLDATVGQTAAGPAASTNYKVNSGYWQNFVSGCCIGFVGNVDCSPGDGVDIGDLTALIDNLFLSFSPLCCIPEANCDGDPGNNIDIGDLTALIDNLFVNFSPLPGCQ